MKIIKTIPLLIATAFLNNTCIAMKPKELSTKTTCTKPYKKCDLVKRRIKSANNFLSKICKDISVDNALESDPVLWIFLRTKFIKGQIINWKRNFGTNLCSDNGISLHRCSQCGWIGFPERHLTGENHYSFLCRNCYFGLGSNTLKTYNSVHEMITKKFGLCPNSTNENPHFGFINDYRICKKYIKFEPHEGMNTKDLKRDMRTNNFWFYCYDCKKLVAVPISTLE